MKNHPSDENIIQFIRSNKELDQRKGEQFLFDKCKNISHQHRRLLPDEQHREDAFILALKELIVIIKDIDNNIQNIDAFFYRIFYYKCIDFHRRNTTIRENEVLGDDALKSSETTTDPMMLLSKASQDVLLSKETNLIKNNKLRLAFNAFKKVKFKCYEIFRLHHLEGYSYLEISKKLGESLDKIETRMANCAKQILMFFFKLDGALAAFKSKHPVCGDLLYKKYNQRMSFKKIGEALGMTEQEAKQKREECLSAFGQFFLK